MKSNKILKIIAIVSGILTMLHVVIVGAGYLLSYIVSRSFRDIANTSVAIIGSADGPTSIYVSNENTRYMAYITFAVCLIVNIVSVVLLLKKRK